MSLEKRVMALEAAAGAPDPSFERPWHRVIVREGQSLADALRAYGIEKIGEHDNLVVRTIVSRNSPPPDSDVGIRRVCWRKLCGL